MNRYVRVCRFRFLDLPAEVRNIIYSLLLVFHGPVHPVSGLPTSVTLQYIQLRKEHREALAVPRTALEILCINQQTHQEAAKIFYHDNELIFSAPGDLQAFLYTLGRVRLDSLRSVTFFHLDRRREAKVDRLLALRLKDAVLTMRLLPGLRKFHLLIELSWRERDSSEEENPADLPYRTYPAYLPRAEGLFKLKNIADIACRHLPADDWKTIRAVKRSLGKTCLVPTNISAVACRWLKRARLTVNYTLTEVGTEMHCGRFWTALIVESAKAAHAGRVKTIRSDGLLVSLYRVTGAARCGSQ